MVGVPRRWAVLGGAMLLLVTACESTSESEPPASTQPSEGDGDDATDESDEPSDEPDEPEEPEEPEEPASPVDGSYGVSAGHPDAVDAGMAVLEDGGTAADAVVAAAYAVSVVEPFASGVGGGGAALVLEQDADPRAYDYREVVAEDGTIPASNTGTPGFVAGMERLRSEHGSMELDELIAPAVELAEGAVVSELVAERLSGSADVLPVGDLPHLFPDGAPLSAGETMVQDELADTLRTIAEQGPEAVYEGEIAESLSASIDGIDGDTLAGYEVQSTEPPTGSFGEHEIIGAAPPLPGTSLIQQLHLAEALGVADLETGSADEVHALAASWHVALAHQEWDLGDPDFVDVPVDELIDPERNQALADQLDLDSVPAVDPEQPRGGLDPNTTHITVVDDEGTMVSMTNTVTNFWGSRQYHRGFFLNDHLRRFDEGRGEANRPEPGKRTVTWSLPAIVADEQGRPVLGLGTPGGARIPNVLASVLTRWGLHDQPLQEVIDAPRFHLQGTTLELEQDPGPLRDDLLARGWSDVVQEPAPLHFGSVQALEIDYDDAEIIGATDQRREADHRIEQP